MSFALRRPILFTLAAVSLSAAGLTARAETIVHQSISYFTIGGRTAGELDRELQRNGPLLNSTGRRHPGATRIRFGGDITYVQQNGRCRIGNARVTVTAKIMLPRWKYRKNANRRLAFLWDTLSSDIRRHEERHAEIARTHARDMEQALSHLTSEKTCATLQQKVSALSQAKVEEHDRDQARFDRVESANFEDRMIRLLKARLSRQDLAKTPG